MIINDQHSFVFVHIPKCGGTGVREKLASYGADVERYGAVVDHPELGKIDLAHIPLNILENYFYDAYRRLEIYRSYGVTRNPFDRFTSSFAQRASTYLGKTIREMPKSELSKNVDQVINYLTLEEEITNYQFIHFERQLKFIELNGKTVIDNLYPLIKIREMLADIGALIGEDIGANDAIAQTMTYRAKAMKPFVHALEVIGRTKIGQKTNPGIKDSLRRILYVPVRDELPKIFYSQYVADFISYYYSGDIDLYERTVKSNHAVAS